MIRLNLAVLGALAAALAAGCEKEKIPPPDRPGKVVVVASIFPIADLVKQIGGDHVEVQCLLDPGVSPHGFSAKASHVERISKARLLVMVGMGLDEWARKAADQASGNARLVELTKDPDFLQVYRSQAGAPAGSQDANLPPAAATASAPATAAPGESREAEGEHHHHEGADPHVWLSPLFMEAFTTTLVGELAKVDPASASLYLARGRNYIEDLRRLDQDYRKTLSAVKTRSFLTYHEAFGYIAQRYGLEQMAVDEIGVGSVGAGRLEAVRKFLKDNKVQAIFVEPQYPAEKLETLARETGAKVGRLDPEGNPNVPGYDSYLAMMRSNLRELAKGLGEGK
jgi:ABC-type Zn uptake system ZnuABC Zn-binding protein ZnuA